MFQFKPKTIKGLRFTDVQYHRNGISGQGFYCATVKSKSDGNLIITYFPNEEDLCYCAVYSLDKLPDIRFGYNSWRGDDFASYMSLAIKEHGKQFDAYLSTL